jgi:hypothetical protein
MARGSLRESGIAARGRRPGIRLSSEKVVMASFRIGFVLFPGLTQLGLTGPHEIPPRVRRAVRGGGTDGGVMRVRLL